MHCSEAWKNALPNYPPVFSPLLLVPTPPLLSLYLLSADINESTLCSQQLETGQSKSMREVWDTQAASIFVRASCQTEDRQFTSACTQKGTTSF